MKWLKSITLPHSIAGYSTYILPVHACPEYLAKEFVVSLFAPAKYIASINQPEELADVVLGSVELKLSASVLNLSPKLALVISA